MPAQSSSNISGAIILLMRNCMYGSALALDWKRTKPDAPDELWYKDFGSFKLCGDAALPLTLLTRAQKAHGTKL